MRMSNEVEVVAFLAQESRGFAYTKRQMPVHRNSFIVYSHAVPNSNSANRYRTPLYSVRLVRENRTHLINSPLFPPLLLSLSGPEKATFFCRKTLIPKPFQSPENSDITLPDGSVYIHVCLARFFRCYTKINAR